MSMWDTQSENSGPKELLGVRLTPAPRERGHGHDLSGDEALGHSVPFYRQQAAYEFVKSVVGSDSERALSIVGRVSGAIRKDQPKTALEIATSSGIDVTGAYRLLAVLLAAPRPTDPAGAPTGRSESPLKVRVRGNPATGFRVVG